jgi:hypothetical protein
MHEAAYPPSADVAVMVATPALRAVTKPPALTEATLLLLLVHVRALFGALSGATVAVRSTVLLPLRVTSAGVMAMPVTTLALHCAFSVRLAVTLLAAKLHAVLPLYQPSKL